MWYSCVVNSQVLAYPKFGGACVVQLVVYDQWYSGEMI